jgi:hypothetical protein
MTSYTYEQAQEAIDFAAGGDRLIYDSLIHEAYAIYHNIYRATDK